MELNSPEQGVNALALTRLPQGPIEGTRSAAAKPVVSSIRTGTSTAEDVGARLLASLVLSDASVQIAVIRPGAVRFIMFVYIESIMHVPTL
jgi:hypothetical protein